MPSQDDIDSQLALLDTHRRNLGLYINQQSMFGAAYIPPALAHGIREARDNIARIKGILHSWGVAIEDHPKEQRLGADHPSTRLTRANLAGVLAAGTHSSRRPSLMARLRALLSGK